MKTSIKTLLEFLPHIKNTFNNNYHNGFIEGNNNFIKVIKKLHLVSDLLEDLKLE